MTTGKAESPLINLGGAKFWFSADFFRGLGDAPQPWELDYPYFARMIKLVYYTEDLEVTGTPLTMFNISGFNRPSTNATFRKIAYTVYDDSYKPIPVDTWYRDMMQGPRTGYPAKYIKIILSLDSAWTPPDYKIRNPMVTTTGHWQDFMKYGGYWLDGTATMMLQKPWTVEAVKSSLIEWEEVIPTGKHKVESMSPRRRTWAVITVPIAINSHLGKG